MKGKKKNRPEIKFEIYQTRDKTIWKMFAKHHYLSHTHNNAASVYLALINDEIAGFLSVLHFPHPKSKNIKELLSIKGISYCIALPTFKLIL